MRGSSPKRPGLEQRVAALAHHLDDDHWEASGRDVDTFLHTLENLLWPSRFIIDGGVRSEFDEFELYLRLRTPVVAADDVPVPLKRLPGRHVRLANERRVRRSRNHRHKQSSLDC
ncbi:MAG: hypothetical protein ACJAXA_002050 [Candidatus Aldehydirespiratoraceae bacterium]|jgi:hypothetical protein